MSTNSKDQNVVSGSMVLTTSVPNVVIKFIATFVAIGLAVGILAMLFFGFGLHETLFSPKDPEAMAIVAHNASNEGEEESGETTEPEVTGIEAILKECNVDFAPHSETYTGSVIKIEATNVESLVARGVSVTYVNNAHIDVGTYDALAIFSAEGYEPVIKNAELKIVKASLKAENFTFADKLVEYVQGTVHSLEIEEELPEGVEVMYALNEAEEVGVYNATAVLYGKNYDNLTLSATLTVVDLTKLVYFPGIEADEETGEEAIRYTYNKKEQSIALNTSAVLKQILEERNFKVTYKVTDPNGVTVEGDTAVFTNAGKYQVVAVVSADGFTTFEVPVTIIVNQGSITSVHGISYNAGDLEYNGNNKVVVIKSSEETFPENISYIVKYFLVTGEGESLVYVEVPEVKNPGNYRAVIELLDSTGNCKNNVEDNVINYDFTVTKRNVDWLYTVEDGKSKYSTVTIKHEDGTSEKVGKVNNLVFTFNAENLHDTILAQPLVVTFTHGGTSVVVTFTFEKEVIKDSEGNEVQTDNDVVVATYVIDGVEYETVHDYNNVEFTIPIDFVNQGTYAMDVLVSGNEFDADVSIKPTMFIDYATLSGVSVTKSTQIVLVNGNVHTPKLKGVSNTALVEIYDKNDNLVEGFKYAYFGNVKMVITDGNYQTTKTVRYFVIPNPTIALIGIIIGAFIGLVVGILSSGLWIKKEKASAVHFRGPSAIVANARGGIICESYAQSFTYDEKTKKAENKCAGRLYLSSKSLEFYAEDYKALKDNFLIDIDDIRNVDFVNQGCIRVHANKSTYYFAVPEGSAATWVDEIIKA